MKNFTDKGIAALKPPAEGLAEYRDPALPGFGIRVSPKGTKTFFLARRVLREGEWAKSRISLGRYPTIKLKEAREKARELAVEIKKGKDPRIEQEQERAEITAASANTFAKAAGKFMEKYVEKNTRPSTAKEYRRALQGADTALWRDRPITSITQKDVDALLARLADRGVTTGANRTLAYLKKFFKWCAARKLIELAPTLTVEKPVKERRCDRWFDAGELVEVWWGTEALPLRPRLVVRSLLLTAQRRGEVSGMRWAELSGLGTDEPVWCLPAARTKNNRPHRVPLSPKMIELIEEAREQETGEFVFGAGDKPLWLGSREKARIDAAIAANRLAAGVAEPMPHWTFHDLRRTAVTHMYDALDLKAQVVEAVVNHISGTKGGVAGVYNQAKYSVQKRDALNRWAARVDLLLRQAAGENVVSLGTGSV